ncbi:hypothetical protein [Mycolicibacterium fortuitum]|uniref:Uncharacterized protein n=1 Tax=Mycolicibacterium fortuitum TaxID=1766 RepID=A0AAE4VDX2_MYCFO|nr:hypothetical protein [Mycolicibacterium fortuitum]MCV7137852.1 hypothetical protein [Mycolicibacterium fortuitum]MDV7193358.1 hypothetical protein [Mycolicibacterium fortuitum]MDV7205961.1 hypothetical protein [Mycolicibacterium fortuitum]MDV7227374.1 hypothetical protein [Mycolicibacterium fortuitum]MDV7259929.1 hypothetical protein [Mycolicibacterium fortuitum]
MGLSPASDHGSMQRGHVIGSVAIHAFARICTIAERYQDQSPADLLTRGSVRGPADSWA